MANNDENNVDSCLAEMKDENSNANNDMKEIDFIAEQKDSRLTDPEGAQSPASSTYADCEETDIPNSENPKEICPESEKTEPVPESIFEKQIGNISSQPEEKNDEIICDRDLIDIKPAIKSSEEHTNLFNTEESEPSPEIIYNAEEIKNDEIYEEQLPQDEPEVEDENYKTDNSEFSDFDSNENDDRENGDGEEINEGEVTAEKKLDDDEDRRNPQYIPKKGFFYEHDDRTVAVSTDEEGDEKSKKETAKEAETKVRGRRSIPDGKWQHDLYKEEEQKAKSSQELIDIYGYDIRNEESAPKARRRRKYGRGPNKYTRKWDDEDAYARQVSSKGVRQPRQNLPHHREEYEAEFPAIQERGRGVGVKIHERRDLERAPRRSSKPSPKHSPKRSLNHELSDNEVRYKDDYRGQGHHRVQPTERSRSFTKRVPVSNDRTPIPDRADVHEMSPSERPARKNISVTVSTGRSRGRGIAAGRNVRIQDVELPHESRCFTAVNRGRGKRLMRLNPQLQSKLVDTDELNDLTNQMAAADLKSEKRSAVIKNPYLNDIDNVKSSLNEQSQNQIASTTVRSKRYSHQRHRLLPESNGQNSMTIVNLHQGQNMPSMQREVQNLPSGVSIGQAEGQTRTSLSYVTQTQLASAPQNADPSLAVNASSLPSSSLAVSASLIPLSAPALTASATALPNGAPPLPIVGFFQHPQGYTNQGTPAQLYTRDQSVIAGPSNQPVQLVAFLPASPMLSNTNHSQTAPPPPPPPPPATFPTTVMSYQSASQTQQSQPSFNSETYAIPPVTLAPMPQAPEMYQSRGGVTYYNTRSQFKPRSPPPPRVKLAIPIVPPPPSSDSMK